MTPHVQRVALVERIRRIESTAASEERELSDTETLTINRLWHEIDAIENRIFARPVDPDPQRGDDAWTAPPV